jgi:acetyl esterase
MKLFQSRGADGQEPTPTQPRREGRLANPAITPATDPRLDPRLRKVMIDNGMGELAASPATTRADGMQQIAEETRLGHEGFNGLYEALPNGLPGDVDVPFETRTIKGRDGNDIALRIYRAEWNSQPSPCVIYIHGGGMTILDAFNKVHHRWCQDFAASGLVSIGVEFRNAYTDSGLNPYPAGLNDCLSAVLWVHEHRAELGISRIVVQGESGGANLSLATALKAKREGRIDAIDGVYATVPYISGGYGWDDARKLAELPSLIENDGFFVSCAMMDLLVAIYDPADQYREDPLSWPYFAGLADLAGLPPHVISVNELDPLRDEGVAYYRRLLAAGVAVRGRTNLGLVHGADMIFRQAIPDAYRAGVADIVRFARGD